MVNRDRYDEIAMPRLLYRLLETSWTASTIDDGDLTKLFLRQPEVPTFLCKWNAALLRHRLPRLMNDPNQ